MKKQIFILALFVLAFFASVHKSYGQAVHNTTSTPITCSTTDGLAPIAGISYDYSAVLNPAGGTAIWHAVYKPTELIKNGAWMPTDEVKGGSFISDATGYGSNATAASPSVAKITWKTEGLASVDATNRLILAIEYQGVSPACADNLQVFEIKPKNAFTVDIWNVTPDLATTEKTTAVSQCFSDIAGAVFNPASPSTVAMNYGDNTMYFEVVAANFTTSFKPTFKISGLQTGQTADIYWGYEKSLTGTATQIEAGVFNKTLAPITALTNELNTSTGVSIYVRVVVHNGSFEGLNDTPITLAVEAVNSANQADVLTDCSVTIAGTSDFEDFATQNLNKRPTVTTTITGGFLNKN